MKIFKRKITKKLKNEPIKRRFKKLLKQQKIEQNVANEELSTNCKGKDNAENLTDFFRFN